MFLNTVATYAQVFRLLKRTILRKTAPLYIEKERECLRVDIIYTCAISCASFASFPRCTGVSKIGRGRISMKQGLIVKRWCMMLF